MAARSNGYEILEATKALHWRYLRAVSWAIILFGPTQTDALSRETIDKTLTIIQIEQNTVTLECFYNLTLFYKGNARKENETQMM